MIKADLEEGVRETEEKRADIIHLTEENIEAKTVNSSKSDRRSRKKYGHGRDDQSSNDDGNDNKNSNDEKSPSQSTTFDNSQS
ncbi:4766_t:CDS:2 [Funneliformis mosseae]|uniref:4766_t:CDS:1 n=1 Tax=Funneliformis mosseae TaxID=27381 RepID=A0A9N9DT47_FUNMO|nr:4766_t:CDS:2 [Funneliformis mosseae]